MHLSPDTLPPDVQAALKRGNTIDAIKCLRAATGLGLKEAKDLIDESLRRTAAYESPAAAEQFLAGEALPASVTAALAHGNKIEAIRLMRELTGMNLKDAKDAIEGLRPTVLAPDGGAPGEVRSKGSGSWWMVAAAIAAIVGYYFFSMS